MDDQKRIVEINGVKIEVDLRTAKIVDQYRVGDPVKVLIKEYGDSYQTHSGVIVGFDMFNQLPSINVAYAKMGYNEVEMKFVSINEKSKDTEIAPLQEYERKFDYIKAVQTFDRRIEKLKVEIEQIDSQKSWFIQNYEAFFKDVISQVGE